MNRLIYLIIVCLVSFKSIGCFSQENEPILGIGDKAPPIKDVTWLKGDPVNSFEKGHIYIIEFGYIGCPGCNISIPHMSEITEKYKDQATLISVFYNEKQSLMPKFLESMGNAIKYSVVIDDEEKKTMQGSWLKPAGINYAPAAFIVNQEGVIVWIGTPQKGGGIDKALEEILEGRLPEKGRLIKELNHAYSLAARYAQKAGDLKRAIVILDHAITINPKYSPFYTIKLDYLLRYNKEEGYTYAQELSEGRFKNDPITLYHFISGKISSVYRSNLIQSPDWDLVIAINERAIAINPYKLNSFYIYVDIAEAYFQKKEFKKALDVMEKSIKDLNEEGFNRDEIARLEDYLVSTRDEMKAIIAQNQP